jgi:hypothetical protein
MDRMPQHITAEPGAVEKALGSTTALLLLPGRSILALMPLWSVLSGALMAFAQFGPIARIPQALLDLLLAVSIVGVLWSTWRALVVDVDWANCFQRYPLPAPTLLSSLPYTTPWSPLGRLFARANQLRRWSQEVPVEVAGARYTLIVLPMLILVLSALAGWPLLVLSCAALALAAIEARTTPQKPYAHRASTALRAGMQVGLGWLAGHVTLAPLTWTAVAFACSYAIAYQGVLGLERHTAEPGTLKYSLLLLYGGQIAALAWLAWLGRPLTVALSAFLLAPQWLLLVGLSSGPDAASVRQPRRRWYVDRALPFCMLAMLAAAWAPR